MLLEYTCGKMVQSFGISEILWQHDFPNSPGIANVCPIIPPLPKHDYARCILCRGVLCRVKVGMRENVGFLSTSCPLRMYDIDQKMLSRPSCFRYCNYLTTPFVGRSHIFFVSSACQHRVRAYAHKSSLVRSSITHSPLRL